LPTVRESTAANSVGCETPARRRIERLYRYPIKGFTPEPLTTVSLAPARGFEWDRAIAVSDGSWVYDAASYVPLFKDKFIALMTHPKVANLRLRADAAARHITVATPEGRVFSIDTTQPSDAELFLDYLIDYLELPAGQRPQLLRRDHGAFTDLSVLDSTGAYSGTVRSAISMMNLASVRELAVKMGDPALDIRRFRANIYFDSASPWEEAGWDGKYLRIGNAVGKVVMATPRCIVTAVNPDSGERDRGVLQALLKNYRHKDLGFYVDIVRPGMVSPGDEVEPIAYEDETHELVCVPFAGMNLSIYVRKTASAAGRQDG